jgi:serine/threonine protein phosphatase PrpC
MAEAAQFAVAAATHPGRVRQNNEDAFFYSEELRAVVLADGMGGHNAGEVASHIAVETLREHLEGLRELSDDAVAEHIEALLLQATADAARNVFDAANATAEYQGMGTTLVVAMVWRHTVFYIHVGDSRLYLFRRNALSRLTRDHSVVQELVDEGLFESIEVASAAGVRGNVLTRALGIEEQVHADLGSIDWQSGDLLLLCSDGLSDVIGERELERILRGRMGPLDEQVDMLIDEACVRGGPDNVTVALAEINGGG